MRFFLIRKNGSPSESIVTQQIYFFKEGIEKNESILGNRIGILRKKGCLKTQVFDCISIIYQLFQ